MRFFEVMYNIDEDIFFADIIIIKEINVVDELKSHIETLLKQRYGKIDNWVVIKNFEY